MFKTNNHIIGEETLILERYENFQNSGNHIERIAPNYFNRYLNHTSKYLNKITEDPDEMRFIQHNYKTRMELMTGCVYGSIFISKDYY